MLQVRESEYIEAARALGFGPARSIFHHVLPDSIQPVIVYTTLFIGAASAVFVGDGLRDALDPKLK